MQKNIDLEKIGLLILAGRRRMGMSQKQLADAVGISQGQVANYERGVHVPNAIIYNRIRHELNLNTVEKEVFDRKGNGCTS